MLKIFDLNFYNNLIARLTDNKKKREREREILFPIYKIPNI